MPDSVMWFMLASFNTCHFILINDELVLNRTDKPAEFFDSSQTGSRTIDL